MLLRDSHGRSIHKVRVQLTDACNFRCFYCMPESMVFTSPSQLLKPNEIHSIASYLYELGIDEIRVTGGEPTVRAEFDTIMSKLATIPWSKFGLTSNGLLLQEKLPLLKELNCKYINLSLDSLDEATFTRITPLPYFQKVIDTILSAVKMGFQVKINAVIARGFNANGLIDFMHFSELRVLKSDF